MKKETSQINPFRNFDRITELSEFATKVAFETIRNYQVFGDNPKIDPEIGLSNRFFEELKGTSEEWNLILAVRKSIILEWCRQNNI